MPEILPTLDRVFLQDLPRNSLATKRGSLHLLQQAEDRQRALFGEVVAVGPDVGDPHIQPGLRVLYRRFSPMPLGDGLGHPGLRAALEDDILAVITVEAT